MSKPPEDRPRGSSCGRAFYRRGPTCADEGCWTRRGARPLLVTRHDHVTTVRISNFYNDRPNCGRRSRCPACAALPW